MCSSMMPIAPICLLKIPRAFGLSSVITKLFHTFLPSYGPPLTLRIASIMSAWVLAVLY